MFCYPKFKNGKQELTRAYGKTAVSMMNITVYRLKAGEELEIAEPGMETAILILEGDVTMYCEDKEYVCKRKSVFTELPTCLHVSKDVAVIVKANAASEILVQSTENEKVFATRLFRPEDCMSFVSCEGRWENTAVRDVVDIINIKNSPYSNMVLGEVYARQGRWWSYIPHDHPQPEVRRQRRYFRGRQNARAGDRSGISRILLLDDKASSRRSVGQYSYRQARIFVASRSSFDREIKVQI